MSDEVAIIIPHFQTLDLTKHCLSLLCQHTPADSVEIVIIDNGSADGSGELVAIDAKQYPHSIKVLRREIDPREIPAQSHGSALNLGVQTTSAPFVLIMHTDTMVQRDDWLTFLLERMRTAGDRCGAVGSGKQERQSFFRWFLKRLERRWRQLRGQFRPSIDYPRSYCAMYRRAALATHPAMFVPSINSTAGLELHHAMLAAGWNVQLIPPSDLARYVVHLNHATMALNQEFGKDDPHMPRTRSKTLRRIEEFFAQQGKKD